MSMCTLATRCFYRVSTASAHEAPGGSDMDHDPMGDYLDEGETIEAKARAGDTTIVVTDRRLVIEGDGRRLLDIPVDGLRRVQFDIEKRRPAALVFVPES